MQKKYIKLGVASALLTSAILLGETHAVEASEQTPNIQQNGSDSYDRALTAYEAEITKYELDKKTYEDAVARYNHDKEAYEKAQAEYHEETEKYEREIVIYNEIEKENNKRVAEYEAALKDYNESVAKYETDKTAYEKAISDNRELTAKYEADKAAYEEAQAKYREEKEKYEREIVIYNEIEKENNKRVAEYEDALKDYNESVAKYEADKAVYEKAVSDNKELTAKYEADKAAYEKAKLDHALKLTQYQLEKDEYEKAKKEYEDKLAKYNEIKAEWEIRENDFKTKKKEYDDAQAQYKRDVDEYNKKLKERDEQIKRNKQADELENQRRTLEFERKKKEIEEESNKPGRFTTTVGNSLVFTHEPNAKVSIDVGQSGALAMLKDINWESIRNKLSSDKINHEELIKNKIDKNIIPYWDESIIGKEYDGKKFVDSYPIIAKKNQPFKVTYTNLTNSTYDGHKIAKIEYIYEVLETGNDTDTMLVSVAKDPTISVWIRGKATAGIPTKVKLTPIFYDDNGQKIIPTTEKPLFLGMGSMNAGWLNLGKPGMQDGKNLFKELMGIAYDRGAYTDSKFESKYGFPWKDRYEHGYQNTPDNQMNKDFKTYWDSWDEFMKQWDQKLKNYMIDKYGVDQIQWRSEYREIVYKLTNGDFLSLNNSYVSNHSDGYYSDKSIDNIRSWDDPSSPTQYIGAGIMRVTKDDFSFEFGATTSANQRFALNTTVADYYIYVKPKLELQKTPEPPFPDRPNEPTIPEPKNDNPPLPQKPSFVERKFEEPKYSGPTPPKQPKLKEPKIPTPPNEKPKVVEKIKREKPKEPEYKGPIPPKQPELKEPKAPTPPNEKPKVVEKIKREKPKKPEYKGPTPPIPPIKPELRTPTPPTEICEVEFPNVEKQTLPRTGSESNVGISVVGLLTALGSFFILTKRKDIY